MCRALHAEENAILNLVRGGGRLTDNSVLYTTTFPCNLCANKIAEIGIKRVVYAEPYPMQEAIETLKKRTLLSINLRGLKAQLFSACIKTYKKGALNV